MTKHRLLPAVALLLAPPVLLRAAENLQLNPHLNYKKNNFQGPLITGDHMDEGVEDRIPNYIIFFAEFCFNAKRQAQRTVHLYEQYKGRVHFVIIDLSHHLPPQQKALAKKFFHQDVPHTTILDKTGKVVFDYTGEAEESTLAGWLDSTLW